MDFLDFTGEEMYFNEPLAPDVEALLTDASQRYGEESAELSLMRAYFLEPQHLTVLVALYRYFYYRQRYREALITAERAIAIVAERLELPPRWEDLSESNLSAATQRSMTLTRFLLLALKGSAYLLMRLNEPEAALARFEKVAEVDTSDRLGINELLTMARATVAEAAAEQAGDKVRYLKR